MFHKIKIFRLIHIKCFYKICSEVRCGCWEFRFSISLYTTSPNFPPYIFFVLFFFIIRETESAGPNFRFSQIWTCDVILEGTSFFNYTTCPVCLFNFLIQYKYFIFLNLNRSNFPMIISTFKIFNISMMAIKLI